MIKYDDNTEVTIGKRNAKHIHNTEYGTAFYIHYDSTDDISDELARQHLLLIGCTEEEIAEYTSADLDEAKYYMLDQSNGGHFIFQHINIIGELSNIISASGEDASGTTLQW